MIFKKKLILNIKIIRRNKENSNIQMITKDKTDQDILDLLNELILDLKNKSNLKKIESLRKRTD